MTTEERKRFDSLKRKLQEDPVGSINFFAQYAEKVDLTTLSIQDKWNYDTIIRDKAICRYLGIEYKEEDFYVSDEQLAEEWADTLPDKD